MCYHKSVKLPEADAFKLMRKIPISKYLPFFCQFSTSNLTMANNDMPLKVLEAPPSLMGKIP